MNFPGTGFQAGEKNFISDEGTAAVIKRFVYRFMEASPHFDACGNKYAENDA